MAEKINDIVSIMKECIESMGKVMFLLCLFLLLHTHVNAEDSTSRVFYVAKNGNDANTGTIDKPWLTVQKAANNAEPGDIIYVRDGIYSEFVTIKNSGLKGKGFITFKAYPGEKPIFDAGKQTIKKGNTAFFTIEANYIMIDGFEMRNLSASGMEYYPDGILVSNNSNHIQLLNNEIHHIENHSIDGNAHGILIYGNTSKPIQDILIQNNHIHHLTLGNSEALTLSGNVERFNISKNKVHDNNNIGIDVAGFYNACTGNCIDQVRNGTISNNIVYNNSSGENPSYNGHLAAGGIYADGASDIRISHNLVFKNDFGIELASENYGKKTSNIILEKNKIFNNNGAGLIIGGASTSNGGAYKNIIRENEFSLNDLRIQGYGEITIQHQATKNQFINNEFYINKTITLIQSMNQKETSNTINNNKVYFRISIFRDYRSMSF